MRQFFISHNSHDADEAKWLKELVLTAYVEDRVFLSSDEGAGPVGGTEWRAWIRNSLTNADLVLFINSKHSDTAWCMAELGAARLLGKPVLPLTLGPVDRPPPLLADLQIVPLDQPASDLVRLIDNLVPPRTESFGPGPDLVPYQGLEPLNERAAALLFGRDGDVSRVLRDFERGGRARVVVLSGPSGSGKSSMARAGLVPRLRRDGWSVVGPVQPNDLASGPMPELPSALPVVIVVDQAEELLTMGAEERGRITGWIEQMAETGNWFLLTVRSEFRNELGLHIPKPIDHYVPYLGRSDLYEVIRGPARIANLHIEEELVDQLVEDTGSGEALPLLSLTLQELWRRRDIERNELTSGALSHLGGVRGVLQGLADQALRDASDGDAGTAGRVLNLLTRLAVPDRVPTTRSPVRVQSLSAAERHHLEHFVTAGLVAYRTSYSVGDRLEVGVRPSGEHLVDVTHEELFNWPPLAEAITEQRQHNTERRSIERSAREWDKGGRTDGSLLLADERLRFAIDNGLAEVDERLAEYVRQSRRRDRSRRVRILAVSAIALTALVAIILGFEAFRQRNNAVVAEQRSHALRVAAQSQSSIDVARDYALLSAVASYRLAPGPDGERALLEALATPDGPVRYHRGDSADWANLRFLDRGRGLVPSPAGSAVLVDLVTGDETVFGAGTELEDISLVEMERSPGGAQAWFRGRNGNGGWAVGSYDFATGQAKVFQHQTEVRAVAASSNLLVFGDDGGTVSLIDLATGRMDQVAAHGTRVTDVDISRGGRYVASASASGISVAMVTNQELETPMPVVVVQPGQGTAERVVFRRDPEGTADGAVELLAAGSDPVIRRWLVSPDGVVETEAVGVHSGSVSALAVAPEDPVLISADLNGLFQVWDLATGAEPGPPYRGHSGAITGLSMADGQHVITADQTVAITWDLAPVRAVTRDEAVPVRWAEAPVATVVLGAGPPAIVTTDGLVITATGEELAGPGQTSRAWWAGVSGDDGRPGLVFEQRTEGGATDGVDVLVHDGVELSVVAEDVNAVDVFGCSVAFGRGHLVQFVELNGCGGALSSTVDVADVPVAVAWSPDGSELAVGTAGREVLIVDQDSGELVERYTSEQSTIITALALVGDYIVIGHDVGGTTEAVNRIDGTIDLLPGHRDAVRWMTTSIDEQRLFTGGEDGWIGQYDFGGSTPGLITRFSSALATTENDRQAEVRGLRLGPDGSTLVAVQGFEAVAWELAPDRLIATACGRAGRDITAAERRALDLDRSLPVCPS